MQPDGIDIWGYIGYYVNIAGPKLLFVHTYICGFFNAEIVVYNSCSKGGLSSIMNIGDAVLHPRYGVGIIGAIELRLQDGEERKYYVIPKPSISSTIFVPVDTADEVGLRPVSSPDKLQQVIDILSGESGEESKPTEMRNMSWGDPVALAYAIRFQATEPKSRYPKVSEQHQLKRAKKLLTEELSVVLGISEDAVAAIVEGSKAVGAEAAISKA